MPNNDLTPRGPVVIAPDVTLLIQLFPKIYGWKIKYYLISVYKYRTLDEFVSFRIEKRSPPVLPLDIFFQELITLPARPKIQIIVLNYDI